MVVVFPGFQFLWRCPMCHDDEMSDELVAEADEYQAYIDRLDAANERMTAMIAALVALGG